MVCLLGSNIIQRNENDHIRSTCMTEETINFLVDVFFSPLLNCAFCFFCVEYYLIVCNNGLHLVQEVNVMLGLVAFLCILESSFERSVAII